MPNLILFRYGKQGGAEYLSHLDVLRHLQRTFRRAGVRLRASEGFHPHPLLHMAPPSGTGVLSLAEYCAAEPAEEIAAEEFLARYNAACPAGLRASAAWSTPLRINLAADVAAAEYRIDGVRFDPEEILREENFFVEGRKGQANARDRIFALERAGEGMRAVVAFGNRTLRPDEFGAALAARFGGSPRFTRTEAYDGRLRPIWERVSGERE